MIALKVIAVTALGGLAGYLYQRLIGCRSGTCPLTANPVASTLYGTFVGFLIAIS